ARDGCVHVACGGKQQVLHHIDFVPEIEQTEARLQDAHVGFAACDDGLLLLQAYEMVFDFFFLGQIKEVLLEKFSLIPEMPLDRGRQLALAVNGPLECRDDRNSEIAEQASEVPGIRLDLGTHATIAGLRKEELLPVDDGAEAVIDIDAPGHGSAVAPAGHSYR